MNDSLSEQEFWTGIYILIQNYHAINRKIFACLLHKILKVNKGIELHNGDDNKQWQKVYQNCSLNADIIETTEEDLKSSFQKAVGANPSFQECEGFIIFYKFLTKKLQQNVEAVGKIDFVSKTYTCTFFSDNLDDYTVQLANCVLSCNTSFKNDGINKHKGWVDYVLKPKFFKWCKSTAILSHSEGREKKKQTKSLQLVNLENYVDLYKLLKSKYAENALKYWNTARESTDPLKFIYEDLAIAAYLISLWKRVGPPIGFADLGCGNGLLVYILSEEGYNGYGYDVRARKIWYCYPPSTRLFEQTIEPQTFQLTKDVNWLIGNHSDELSPWLPVLAATRGFHINYFLLPCCAYELSGAKFQRRNTSLSVYQDFYTYLETLSQSCGYVTQKDRLKIPSTKRLALVGYERMHSFELYHKKKEDILKLVEAERRRYGADTSPADIKLREQKEAVRNCTQIDKNIIDALVLKIFNKLLSASTNKMIGQNNGEGDSWQGGGALRMFEIAKSLDKGDLQNIKAECGGIKTLLRNKHEIFEFLGDDYVGLRKPHMRSVKLRYKLQTYKKRHCFFHLHHPDGCPLQAEQCTFIH